MKFLILGAGPAGLTFANRLRQLGISDFLILEKEKTAGGLCRSKTVDGFPLDVGGGHFLDIKRPKVNEFLFGFMPEEEWIKYNRDSRIEINGMVIGHPIESNIWQMKTEDQVIYLKSIASAGCNIGNRPPKLFIDWIYWKLGARIAEDYMVPYNQKIFGQELNQLGTYWLEKLPDVSFEETLLSCIEKRPYGAQAGHAQFYYPKKYGYGELWLRMADRVIKNIEYNKSVVGIDFDKKYVRVADGTQYEAETIVTTIPWLEFKEIAGMPEEIVQDIKRLKFSSIQIEYFAKNLDTPCHWIYCPDLSLPYHRILVRHNFCRGAKGYWTETNSERVGAEVNTNHFRHMNKYAYPLNTLDKPWIMKRLLSWVEQKGVIGLGRWGEHEHYNSDTVVERAIRLAERV